MLMSNRQKDIVLGLLLGDGHLEKNGRYSRLRVDQNLVHDDYIYWLYRELKNFVPSQPRVINEKDKRTSIIYRRLHFSTYSIGELDQLRGVFYSEKKKRVPENIENMLKSPISLAIWLMDDGYRRNDCSAIRLNTDSFGCDEQKLLVNCLRKNFHIRSRIHKKGKWFNIYLPKVEAKKFNELVKLYVLPSFKHKLL